MTPETEQRLKEIEAREAKATAGPWMHGFKDGTGVANSSINCGGWILTQEEDIRTIVVGGTDSWDCPEGVISESDADFMAHARADVPWLISQLRERGAEVERLKNPKVSLLSETIDKYYSENVGD